MGKNEDVEETTKDTLLIESIIKEEITLEENDWMIKKDTSMQKINEEEEEEKDDEDVDEDDENDNDNDNDNDCDQEKYETVKQQKCKIQVKKGLPKQTKKKVKKKSQMQRMDDLELCLNSDLKKGNNDIKSNIKVPDNYMTGKNLFDLLFTHFCIL